MKKSYIISEILCVLLACSLIFSGCGQSASESVPETKAEETASAAPQPSVSETTLTTEPKYVFRDDLQTILFMGLDKFEAPVEEMGYLNDQQCDFLLLFVLDEKNQTAEVLQLNRDTMTEIRRLGVGGGDAGKFIGQLALAHTYGSGGSDSCINVTRAVSKLLKGVKIDHYVAMTMAGVSKLNDMVGGVEVEITVDMTSVDPAFQKGAKVLLQGEQALRFIRARISLEDSSNLSRMERHRQYLTGLYGKLMNASESDSGFTTRSLMEMASYIQSDLSVNQLSALADKMKEYELMPFTTIDGEAVKGEKFMEYYVDEESLDTVIQDLFCQ